MPALPRRPAASSSSTPTATCRPSAASRSTSTRPSPSRSPAPAAAARARSCTSWAVWTAPPRATCFSAARRCQALISTPSALRNRLRLPASPSIWMPASTALENIQDPDVRGHPAARTRRCTRRMPQADRGSRPGRPARAFRPAQLSAGSASEVAIVPRSPTTHPSSWRMSPPAISTARARTRSSSSFTTCAIRVNSRSWIVTSIATKSPRPPTASIRMKDGNRSSRAIRNSGAC